MEQNDGEPLGGLPVRLPAVTGGRVRSMLDEINAKVIQNRTQEVEELNSLIQHELDQRQSRWAEENSRLRIAVMNELSPAMSCMDYRHGAEQILAMSRNKDSLSPSSVTDMYAVIQKMIETHQESMQKMVQSQDQVLQQVVQTQSKLAEQVQSLAAGQDRKRMTSRRQSSLAESRQPDSDIDSEPEVRSTKGILEDRASLYESPEIS
jgi:hypothetical protein